MFTTPRMNITLVHRQFAYPRNMALNTSIAFCLSESVCRCNVYNLWLVAGHRCASHRLLTDATQFHCRSSEYSIENDRLILQSSHFLLWLRSSTIEYRPRDEKYLLGFRFCCSPYRDETISSIDCVRNVSHAVDGVAIRLFSPFAR